MEIGALINDDFQVWVPFQEDAEVLIRHVPLDELREIGRKAARVKWDRRQRKAEEHDPVEGNRLLGRAAVRGWKGITMDRAEYPYSPEHCDFLMGKWAAFARFVNEACTDVQALADAERDGAIKKSSLTSGQGSTTRG